MIKEKVLSLVNKNEKAREYFLYKKHQLDASLLSFRSYKFSNRIKKHEFLEKKQKYNTFVKEVVDCARKWSDQLQNTDLKNGTYKLDDFEILSVNGDRLGKALKKDGIFYRGVYRESVDDLKTMWGTGVYQALNEYHLMPKIEITNFYTDEFPIVLKVETYEFIPFSTWSFNMVRDACILIALLKNILANLGCTLIDGHMNNITFQYGRPMFVDVGSIMLTGLTGFQEEVVFSGCFHLLGLQLGNVFLSRTDLCDIDNNMIWVEPRHYGLQMSEYRHSVKRMKRIYRIKSNHLGRKIFHNVFDLCRIEPEYIDVLFPPYALSTDNCPDSILLSFKEIIQDRDNINSVVEINGFSGEIVEKLILDKIIKEGTYIDYNEIKVNSAFSKKIIKHTLLLNYLYPYETNILNMIKSDLAICVDPLSNSGSYQGFDVSSIFINVKRLTRSLVAFIIFPNHRLNPKLKYEGRDLCEWFESKFSLYFELIKKISSKINTDDDQYYIIYLGYSI